MKKLYKKSLITLFGVFTLFVMMLGLNINLYAQNHSFSYVNPKEVTSNYTLVNQTAGELTLTNRTEKYEITVVANSASATYDGSEHEAVGFVTLTFYVDGNTYTVEGLETSDPSHEDVCNLPNEISGTAVVKDASGNDVTSQFTVHTENGWLEITPAQVTVTADDKWKYFGHGDPELTAVVSGGLVAGDEIEYEVNREPGDEVGSYDIIPSGPYTQGNYQVSYVNGTLTILDTQDPGLTCPSGDAITKTYDATPLAPLATALAENASIVYSSSTDGGSTWTEWSEEPASITQAGTLSVMAKVTAPNFEEATCPYTLTVNKRPITLDLDSTKVYDGTIFEVNHSQLEVNGLQPWDYFVNGTIISQDYIVNTYYLYEGNRWATYDFGYALQSDFEIWNADGEIVTSSYEPTFTVTLRITQRPITITAGTDGKSYDGTVLTNQTYGLSGTYNPYLAVGDEMDNLTITGSQLCVGESDNTPSNANIIRTTDEEIPNRNVTDCYDIKYNEGTLTVTRVEDAISCPEPETVMLDYGAEEVSVDLELPTLNAVIEDGMYEITNNLPSNELGVGTYTIIWTIRDNCGNELSTSCTQTIIVEGAPCDSVRYNGYTYPAVPIGTQCWMVENLRNTVDASGNPISNYAAYNDDAANVDAFGYLYSWYSAVGVAENVNTAVPAMQTKADGVEYVQGICPEGWAVPSHEDFEILKNYVSGEVRRLRDMVPQYWSPGAAGVEPNYGFNSRAGGFYNSVSESFERMHLEDYYWEANSDPNSTEVTTAVNAYYCSDMLFQTSKRSDKRSVRCIKVK